MCSDSDLHFTCHACLEFFDPKFVFLIELSVYSSNSQVSLFITVFAALVCLGNMFESVTSNAQQTTACKIIEHH